MGLFSGVFGGIGSVVRAIFESSSGGVSGSGNNGQKEIEKYKKEIAELKKANEVEVARLENEKVELIKNAQLELLDAQREATILAEEAKAKGFAVVAKCILLLQERMNELGMRRLEIIEKSSLPIIKNIEAFYNELGAKIKQENDEYSLHKLPVLLQTLQQFEEGSPEYNIYLQRIQKDVSQQTYYLQLQMESVHRRQEQVLHELLSTKSKIVEQTGAIMDRMLDELVSKQLVIPKQESGVIEAVVEDVPTITPQEKKMLPEGKQS